MYKRQLSAIPADLDALGAAAELQFGDSAVRYSHAYCAWKQHAEPACHASMRYVVLGHPPVLPTDFLSYFPSLQRPSFSEIQELAGKGRLHTTDDGIGLLVRQLTSHPTSDSHLLVGRAAFSMNDEPARI